MKRQMDKYRIKYNMAEIEKVKIKKESDCYVWWGNGQRCAKISNYDAYFDTLEEAKSFGISRIQGKIDSYEFNANLLKEDIEKIKSIVL